MLRHMPNARFGWVISAFGVMRDKEIKQLTDGNNFSHMNEPYDIFQCTELKLDIILFQKKTMNEVITTEHIPRVFIQRVLVSGYTMILNFIFQIYTYLLCLMNQTLDALVWRNYSPHNHIRKTKEKYKWFLFY